jgi:ubiquinone/menaquinone biosynthesis C-methylase UbiE
MKLNWVERWFVNSPFRFVLQKIVIRGFKAMMPPAPGTTVLEVGCGRGVGAKLILKEFQPSQLHILDLDIGATQKAKMFLSTVPVEKLGIYVADSVSLPFKSASVDILFGFGFLHHVPDWRQALSEVARVLKPNGVYYLEEFYPELYQNIITKRLLLHPEHDRFSSHDLRNELDKAGIGLRDAFELRKMGILGVAVKSPVLQQQ